MADAAYVVHQTAGMAVPDVVEARWDRDNNTLVQVTAEMKATAQQVNALIAAGFVLAAEALRRMKEEALYVALGYERWDDWIEAEFPLGRTRAYQLVAVARRLSRDVIQTLTEGGKGVTKLIALAALPEPQVERLNREGRVDLGDGDVGMEDLRSMPATDLEDQVAALKRELRRREGLDREMKAGHEKEVADLVAEVERLQGELAAAKEGAGAGDGEAAEARSAAVEQLSEELGKTKRRLETALAEKEQLLQERREALQQATSRAGQIGRIQKGRDDAVEGLKRCLAAVEDGQRPDLEVIAEASAAAEQVRVLVDALQSKVREGLAAIGAGED